MSVLARIHAAQPALLASGAKMSRLEVSPEDYRELLDSPRIADMRHPLDRWWLVTDYGTLEIVLADVTAICWRDREPKRLECIGWNRVTI